MTEYSKGAGSSFITMKTLVGRKFGTYVRDIGERVNELRFEALEDCPRIQSFLVYAALKPENHRNKHERKRMTRGLAT